MRTSVIFSIAYFLVVSLVNGKTRGRRYEVGGRVVGGSEANITDYPFMVSISSRKFDGTSWEHSCGGSILTSRVILTACHCLPGSLSDLQQGIMPACYVLAGVSDLSRAWVGQRRKVSRMVAHPQCGENPNVDVATMELDTPFVLNEVVQPISLYTNDKLTARAMLLDLEVGHKRCFAPGWGNTDSSIDSQVYIGSLKLKVTPADLLESTECSELFCQTAKAYCGFDFLGYNLVCASSPEGIPCNGDSGGPLVCDGLLVGVYGWKEQCIIGWPFVFLDLVPTLDLALKYLN